MLSWARSINGCGLAPLVLLGCTSLLSGASLSVLVKDPGGSVVAGATVTANAKALRSALNTVTDTQGLVRLDQLPAGSYRISVTKDGFESWERTIAVTDRPVDLIVSLKIKLVTDTVQVSGKRSALANSDPNYIALRGGKPTDVYRVKNLVLHRDVGAFTFRSGSFSFLPPVLGHVAAGVFVGEGNFQLKPAFDIAVKHLHRIAGIDSVDEDFSAVVVYFGDSTFDEIRRSSELLDESPQQHQAAFQRVRDLIEHRREPPSQLMRGARQLTMLERLLNYDDIPNYEAEVLAETYNSQAGSFRAFLHGKRNADLRFLVNPQGALPRLTAPEEVALINYDANSETDGVWYLAHFASELHAGSASSSEEKRLITAEHYQMQVFIRTQDLVGKEPDLSVTCDLKFQSLYDGVRMVKFDLVPDLQVSRVAWNGKEIPFVQESRKKDGSFYVQIPEPLARGRTYQMTFEYAGGEILQSDFGSVPPRRIWYPVPSGPTSRATYSLKYYIPRGATVVSVGTMVSQSREGAFDVSEWSSDVPITQAVFRYLPDPFAKTKTDETSQTELSAFVDPGGTRRHLIASSAGGLLIDAGNALRVFNAWFGPPAYHSLSVVEGPGYTDSLPGLVYASYGVAAGYSLLFPQVRGAIPRMQLNLRKTYVDEAFAREVARQWWGNTVGAASFHDAWLSDGFADFSASLYDLVAKPGEFTDHWIQARKAILEHPSSPDYVTPMLYPPPPGDPPPYSSEKRPNDLGPMWLGLLNDTYKTPNANYIVSSSKGGFILQMLRCMMWDSKSSDDDFRGMMEDFVKQFANQAASTEDFKAVVEKHMKAVMDFDGNHKMDWFFADWVYGTDIPSYSLEYSLSPDKSGKTMLNGTLTQSGVSARFAMPVPIFGEFNGRRVRVGVIPMRGNSTAEFQVLLPESPKRVLLNVDHDVLTDQEEVKPKKSSLH